MKRASEFLAGVGAGILAGWAITQQGWVIGQLSRINVQRTLGVDRNQIKTGLAFKKISEKDKYSIVHTIEDGIERIVYLPRQRRFQTPIVMQHGMWHGAWCWQLWQELFAEWGWETHAHSLPGHAGSPLQRPLAACTLDYYLSFVKAQVERQARCPILMGHSMGGALTQWCLKYVRQDLPAAVLVAPWTSHSMFVDNIVGLLRRDPLCIPLMMLSRDATPMVRSPRRAAQCLISDQAVYSPSELYAKLGSESAMVLYQHNPPFWFPPENVKTPMLWLAGQDDTLIGEPAERRSAAHYGADYVVVEKAGHNLMMEHNYRQTAEQIHNWLVKQEIE